jgi:uncharacterized protein (DUF111 family)
MSDSRTARDDRNSPAGEAVLTVRALSGLSGDMMLTGLALMTGISNADLAELAAALPLPEGAGVEVERREVQNVRGWGAVVNIPHEHVHRNLNDIRALIEKSSLQPDARGLAVQAFVLLAEAEGKVHGKPPEEIHFHEVGAVDSILDICLVCALFVKLNPARFVCSPLPVADGGVFCAHGLLPVPAPAVLEMLIDVPVCGFPACGETLTPTALALLKTLKAEFGPWPDMVIRRRALVYGGKVFEGAVNGSVWAFGEAGGLSAGKLSKEPQHG